MITRVGLRAAASLAQFGIMALIARTAGVNDFGSYAVAISITTLLSSVLQLGVPGRLIAGNLRHRFSQVLTITSTAAMVTFAATAFGLAILQKWDAPWAPAVLAYLVSDTLITASVAYLYGSLRTRTADLVLVGQRVLPMVAVVVGAAFFPDAIFACAAIGYATTLVLLLAHLRQPRTGSPSRRALIKEARPYWSQSLANSLQQTDVAIIGSGIGATAAGGYSTSFRLASPIHLITIVLTTTYVPTISASTTNSNRRQLRATYWRHSARYAAVISLLSPTAAWIGPWLFGNEFEEFSSLFVLFVLNSAASVLNQCLAGLLYTVGRADTVATLTWVGVLLALTGAALAAALSNLTLAAVVALGSQVVLYMLLSSVWAKTTRQERA